MNTTLKVKIGQFNTETLERLMELLNILYDQHKDVSIRPKAEVSFRNLQSHLIRTCLAVFQLAMEDGHLHSSKSSCAARALD